MRCITFHQSVSIYQLTFFLLTSLAFSRTLNVGAFDPSYSLICLFRVFQCLFQISSYRPIFSSGIWGFVLFDYQLYFCGSLFGQEIPAFGSDEPAQAYIQQSFTYNKSTQSPARILSSRKSQTQYDELEASSTLLHLLQLPLLSYKSKLAYSPLNRRTCT